MKKKKRGRGKPFKKGAPSPNPHGRPKLTEEEKKIRNLTKAEFLEILARIVKGKKSDLRNMAKDPNTSILATMVSAVSKKIIKKGDMDAFDKLLTRAIGKPKEQLEVTGNPVQVLVKLPPNGSEKKPVPTPQ